MSTAASDDPSIDRRSRAEPHGRIGIELGLQDPGSLV